ncbi:MAG: tyrosine-protein phosphatase [Candidatus Omnitrophica bacterium]|nr:tyrosine-protein phosphatase [Candidatus Omnitrophota bacterium]
MNFPRRFCAAILAFALIFSGDVQTSAEQQDEAMLKNKIEHFAKVADGLYRGAQPPEEAFPPLRDFGIRTVVNFRHEKDRISEEGRWAGATGLNYVSIPWKIYESVPPAVLKEFFSVIDDPAKKPVFFHCKRGAERTGVVSVLYRMKYDGLTRKAAEELELDPYPVTFFWKPFVRKRIGELEGIISDPEGQKKRPKT